MFYIIPAHSNLHCIALYFKGPKGTPGQAGQPGEQGRRGAQVSRFYRLFKTKYVCFDMLCPFLSYCHMPYLAIVLCNCFQNCSIITLKTTARGFDFMISGLHYVHQRPIVHWRPKYSNPRTRITSQNEGVDCTIQGENWLDSLKFVFWSWYSLLSHINKL